MRAFRSTLHVIIACTGILGAQPQETPRPTDGSPRATTIRIIKPSANPRGGIRYLAVLVEERLASKKTIQRRVERYAEDIARAYGTGVEVLSVFSDSSRHIKGLLRERMKSGLAGAVFVGNIPRAYGEVYEVHVPRDVFSCDLYFMDQNTRDSPDGGWIDPGWHDEGRPAFRRVDGGSVSQIDFNWKEGSPHAAIPKNAFSARYTASLTAPSDGTYTFIIRSDNGRRLMIDGRQVINAWFADWGKEYSGTLQLKAGIKIPFVLEYFEDFGGADLKLLWKPPAASSPVVVPPSAFTNLRVEYFNNKNLRTDEGCKTERCFAGNGIFDRVSDGTPGGGNPTIMSPDIFISRIETGSSSTFGDEEALLSQYFDKNHAYWTGTLPLGNRAVVSFGEGSTSPEPAVVSRVGHFFGNGFIDTRVNPTGPERYLKDLRDPRNLVSVYCGHGNEGGIGLGLASGQLAGVEIQPLFIDLESCSPLRTIRTTEAFPDGETLSSYIGGAHLYLDGGKGRCLAVKGATKTSGGNQREEYFYASLAEGNPIGKAYLDWSRKRLQSGGNPAEWFDWFYPQTMIGDPMIVIGPAPVSPTDPSAR